MNCSAVTRPTALPDSFERSASTSQSCPMRCIPVPTSATRAPHRPQRGSLPACGSCIRAARLTWCSVGGYPPEYLFGLGQNAPFLRGQGGQSAGEPLISPTACLGHVLAARLRSFDQRLAPV